MLWNSVYEFFIKYIFGGTLADGTFAGAIIGVGYSSDGSQEEIFTDSFKAFQYYDYYYGDNLSLSLGNYLSLIATIIIMVVILVLCCALIKKIYNICAHVIG